MADFSIVLMRPEIPHNTGAIGRLCVGLGVPLHLIRPLGFHLDDKSVARAGLDYWPYLDLHIHDTWEEFLEYAGRAVIAPYQTVGTDRRAVRSPRLFFLSTHGEKSLYDCKFVKGDFLVFGNESSGLPKSFYETYKSDLFKIPMPGEHAR